MESSKEFALKWNNFSNNLTTGFISHLSENDLVDVTLAVEGQLITAHKLVLSVCSPYFKNIFKRNPCQHPVIILKDVNYTEMEALLKFMYQGEVNIKHKDLSTFLKIAQMLQIRGLETSEGQIIALINDYINTSDIQSDSEYTTTLSDATSEQESRKQSLDGSVYSQEMSTRKRNVKENKRHTTETDNSHKRVKSETSANSNDTLYFLSDNEENSSRSEKVTTPRLNNSDEIMELRNEDEGNLIQSVVEPVTYRLSSRGRPQLVHEGYVYNLTSRSKTLNRSHYRCAEQHHGCRGKCAVIAERFMPTGVRDHNHLPSDQSVHRYRKKKDQNMDNV